MGVIAYFVVSVRRVEWKLPHFCLLHAESFALVSL